MSKTRILVVSQHFWPESFRINDIVDYFVEQNLEVDVLCGLPNYPSGQFSKGYGYFGKRHEVHNGAHIERVLEIKRGNNSNVRIFLNYVSFPFFSLFHIPKILNRKYDRIFIYQLSPVMMSLAGILIGKIKKVETSMYVLDMWPENLFSVLKIKNKRIRNIATFVSHWHYRNVDKLIVLTEMMKINLIQATKKNPEDFIVLPQSTEKIFENNTYDKNLVNRFKNGFNILFTGNISPAQSFKTIIRAAKKLESDGFKNINWIVVGNGMSKKDVEEDVRLANLEHCFYFEGEKPTKDIPKYTYISDVLVGCLAKSELLEATIPAKVMSYIAAGKPIVLAMDGEVQELINNKIKCGIVGPAGDSDKLSDNIKTIYKMSKSDRQKMGNRSLKYHKKYLSREILLQKLLNFVFDES